MKEGSRAGRDRLARLMDMFRFALSVVGVVVATVASAGEVLKASALTRA